MKWIKNLLINRLCSNNNQINNEMATTDYTQTEKLRQLEVDLERVHLMINNCDQKASIILATIGILVGLFFSTDSVTNRILELPKLLVIDYSNCDILRLLLNSVILFAFLLTITLIFSSIFYLLKALKSNTDPDNFKNIRQNNNSTSYFAEIAQKDFETFKEERKESTTKNRIDDMISQLYINSKICTKKFENYQLGITLFLICIPFICFDIIFLI